MSGRLRLALPLGLAVLVLAALLVWARAPEPAAQRAAPAPPGPPAAPPAAPREARPEPPPQEPAAAAAPEAPPAAPAATLRREPKLADEPLSDVAHEVVGAWDDRGSAPELGVHRVLVAVVSPAATDAEIERLLRDTRARHRDAEVLDVRVYDSGVAAAQAGWLGERRLVGELKRNDRLDYDAMTVRGKPVAP